MHIDKPIIRLTETVQCVTQTRSSVDVTVAVVSSAKTKNATGSQAFITNAFSDVKHTNVYLGLSAQQ